VEQPAAPGTEGRASAGERHRAELACLLVHGLGGGLYELEPLAESLASAGWIVASMTLPGHEEPGPVMPASRWEDWYSSVERHFDELSAAGRPVAVIGFSTGGTLAARLALHRPVSRLVLLAPFLAIRYTPLIPWVRPEAVVSALCRVLPDVPRMAPPIRDPHARQVFACRQRYRTFSMPATLSALELIRDVEPRLPELTIPTLICQGRRDSVVDPSGARRILRAIGSTDPLLVWLPRSDHLVAWDYDRLQVIEALEVFLDQASTGLQPSKSPAPTSPSTLDPEPGKQSGHGPFHDDRRL
jgi:carboxylesterase